MFDDDARQALLTQGLIDAEVAARLPAELEQGTWSDALETLGLEGSRLDAALEVIERIGGLPEDAVTDEAEGRYARVELLGAGGMGQVALVEDRHLHRLVARKELHAQRPAIAARFLREARVTAQLEHPGIVPVYEVGKSRSGRLYYTMKRVQGRTLREALDTCSSLPERLRLLSAFVEVCQAVGYAHAKGVVHRDLKPENVMIGPFGETLVLDWGLAKVAGEADIPIGSGVRSGNPTSSGASDLTRAGTVMGTPRYMSPEQAAGRLQDIDARSDVWSLGVILYELLSGEAPFQGSADSLLMQVQQGLSAPVRQTVQGAPPELAAICEKALGTSRGERYDHAGELADEIEAWRNGATVAAHVYTPVERARRFADRFRSVGSALAAVVVTGALAAGWYGPRITTERDRAEQIEQHAAFLSRLVGAAELDDPTRALALLRDAERRADPDDRPKATRRIATLLAEGADARVVPRPAGSGAPFWSSNGTMLAWTEPDAVVVFDPASGSALGKVSATAPTAAAFDPGGDRLFVVEGRRVREVTLVDTRDKRTFDLPFEPVTAGVSPDGRWLALAARGATSQAYIDLASGAMPDPLTVPAWAPAAAASNLAIDVDRVRVRTTTAERTLRAGSAIVDVVASPKGELAVATATELRLWAAGAATNGTPTTNLRACPDGRVVAVLPFPHPHDLDAGRACGP